MFDLIANSKEALLIFAHPDDETCWAGGLIVSNPHIDWYCICCSYPRRKQAEPRRYDYFDACSSLGVSSRLIDIVETDPKTPLKVFCQLKISNINNYDFIVTHGAAGDYGHEHHKSIYKYVSELATIPIITTGYGKGKYVLDLSDKMYDKKLEALKCYKVNQYKVHGKEVEKWEALLHVYPILKEKKETFNLENNNAI